MHGELLTFTGKFHFEKRAVVWKNEGLNGKRRNEMKCVMGASTVYNRDERRENEEARAPIIITRLVFGDKMPRDPIGRTHQPDATRI